MKGKSRLVCTNSSKTINYRAVVNLRINKNKLDISTVETVFIYNCGDHSRKDPPVPIPNTEVKLSYAESSSLNRAQG